jgi:hypothetical protein
MLRAEVTLHYFSKNNTDVWYNSDYTVVVDYIYSID